MLLAVVIATDSFRLLHEFRRRVSRGPKKIWTPSCGMVPGLLVLTMCLWTSTKAKGGVARQQDAVMGSEKGLSTEVPIACN